jgi:TetR/AcrR family transcriptional repressor of nem operon
MPWEKRFDVEETLDKAMRAFWARGYEATSLQDLLDCMGINRGSFYATYGDKRKLFMRALDRYDRVHREAWIAGLDSGGSAREAIAHVFEDAIAAVLERGTRDGCLLVNTALELSPHDEEIQRFVGNALREMEDYFAATLARGQADGEIGDHIDPRQTAASLLSMFIGLRVLSRSRPEAPLLRSIAAQAQAILE